MSVKAFSAIALLALLATSAIPMASNADLPDSALIIGKWEFEKTETTNDDTHTSTTSLRFDIGGKGKLMHTSETETDGYTDETVSESEFSWKIDGEILYIYYPPSFASTRADPDWNEAVQYKYEFESTFTKLLLYRKTYTGDFSATAEEFDKSGDVCGICCPCCFMYFAIAPVALIAGLALKRSWRNW